MIPSCPACRSTQITIDPADTTCFLCRSCGARWRRWGPLTEEETT